ncbi:hypothetical protein ASPZODRAFT_135286 [Penicilliopsis zonata CBS 506.65]|uniref:NAD(P)-binding domain-containing protein n=1 Tax=Penicilliopsis zonata CBS 506.65 TaxID=1073090 RepID=A0A1L9SBA0_9EURO|nr:hypothetical protein ASPZODRAFT_135286 [Penicilliopsis zonata CBS 506.65]OJJ44460.1 hypothetical protein ASPZODRAFT_135286 [Penicilliopsis zonata CBS 506.65]
MTIRNVAIFGASGNFGTPITAALINVNFCVTIISRIESTSQFPEGIPVIRTEYTLPALTEALTGQDAVVCVVGPAGIHHQNTMIDAAEAAGVRRFIIDDFGWGPNVRGLPEFEPVRAQRRVPWDHAEKVAARNPNFTYCGIATGNPIDWALKRFPKMGFNLKDQSAVIYDAGNEMFTGTTLQGIGQAVVGVLSHLEETKNRLVKVQSIQTCQNELLAAFEKETGTKWSVERLTTRSLKESGRRKLQAGDGGWVLDLVVAQLFDEGEARCLVARTREDSDAELLGIKEETADGIATAALTL